MPHDDMQESTLSDSLSEDWMQEALNEAAKAEALGEVPIGAVIVQNGEIIGRGYNRSITDHDPTAHAEVMALRDAGKNLANYRMPEATLYVTLEPCPQCLGAISHARVKRVVFGASDPKTGACGGKVDLSANPAFIRPVAFESGVLAGDCAETIRAFFRAKRREKGLSGAK